MVDDEEGEEKEAAESIDKVTMGNWTRRRSLVVVEEITRLIDTTAVDRFFCLTQAKYMDGGGARVGDRRLR